MSANNNNSLGNSEPIPCPNPFSCPPPIIKPQIPHPNQYHIPTSNSHQYISPQQFPPHRYQFPASTRQCPPPLSLQHPPPPTVSQHPPPPTVSQHPPRPPVSQHPPPPVSQHPPPPVSQHPPPPLVSQHPPPPPVSQHPPPPVSQHPPPPPPVSQHPPPRVLQYSHGSSHPYSSPVRQYPPGVSLPYSSNDSTQFPLWSFRQPPPNSSSLLGPGVPVSSASLSISAPILQSENTYSVSSVNNQQSLAYNSNIHSSHQFNESKSLAARGIRAPESSEEIDCVPAALHPKDNSVISFKKDQEWVAAFLEKRLGAQNTIRQEHKTETVVKPNKLNEVHRDVAKYMQLLAKLKEQSDEELAKSITVELSTISNKLSSPEYIASVKKLVLQRRHQRERKRRRKVSRKREIEEKHKEIDRQRSIIVKQEKQALLDKQLKHEADSVLKEVRTKQADTNGLLSLLDKMESLRTHRLKRGAQQGFVSSDQQDIQFKTITDGLKNMLLSQLEEYELEERTVQSMLELHNPGQTNSRKNLNADKLISCDSLRDIYFGKRKPLDALLSASYTSADESIEVLINRRRLWDNFISDKDGSSVPLPWVPPPISPNSAWIKFIKKHK